MVGFRTPKTQSRVGTLGCRLYSFNTEDCSKDIEVYEWEDLRLAQEYQEMMVEGGTAPQGPKA